MTLAQSDSKETDYMSRNQDLPNISRSYLRYLKCVEIYNLLHLLISERPHNLFDATTKSSVENVKVSEGVPNSNYLQLIDFEVGMVHSAQLHGKN